MFLQLFLVGVWCVQDPEHLLSDESHMTIGNAENQ